MIKYFIDNLGYSISMIAEVLDRSENYVNGALVRKNVDPDCLIKSDKGPDAAGWSGQTLNELVSNGIINKKVPAGTILWKTGRKPKNALTSVFDIQWR